MKTLLLTSAFVFVTDELIKILPKPPQELTVAFVPTAADLSEDPWYMEADRQKLIDLGFNVSDLPLKGKNINEVKESLDRADIVFVGGGNTFYLLDEANKSGFTELVPNYVDNGMIYVGGSAGSYIACPTIEAAGWTNSDRNVVNLQDLTAMNMVPCIIKAHFVPEKSEAIKQAIAGCKYPVKILTDEQALLVTGDDCKVVGTEAEIIL
jgi:dipeptidase E